MSTKSVTGLESVNSVNYQYLFNVLMNKIKSEIRVRVIEV